MAALQGSVRSSVALSGAQRATVALQGALRVSVALMGEVDGVFVALPPIPAGAAYLVDTLGRFIVDDNGAYLYIEA